MNGHKFADFVAVANPDKTLFIFFWTEYLTGVAYDRTAMTWMPEEASKASARDTETPRKRR